MKNGGAGYTKIIGRNRRPGPLQLGEQLGPDLGNLHRERENRDVPPQPIQSFPAPECPRHGIRKMDPRQQFTPDNGGQEDRLVASELENRLPAPAGSLQLDNRGSVENQAHGFAPG